LGIELDVLVFAAHPDDAELSCGGTIAKEVAKGQRVGVIDLTRGEMGTRGTTEIRADESKAAAEILGLALRENLGLRDGHITNDEASQAAVAACVRRYRPRVVICNAPRDRHPDHGHASELVVDACFKAGLAKWDIEGSHHAAHRPEAIYHYIQYYDLDPDVLVDISGYEAVKMKAIKAHASQFYNPDSDEPETLIASKDFLNAIERRTSEWGRAIGVASAEGFIAERSLGVASISELI